MENLVNARWFKAKVKGRSYDLLAELNNEFKVRDVFLVLNPYHAWKKYFVEIRWEESCKHVMFPLNNLVLLFLNHLLFLTQKQDNAYGDSHPDS